MDFIYNIKHFIAFQIFYWMQSYIIWMLFCGNIIVKFRKFGMCSTIYIYFITWPQRCFEKKLSVTYLMTPYCSFLIVSLLRWIILLLILELYVQFYHSQAHMIVWRAAVFKLRSSPKLLKYRGIETYLLKRCYCCEKQYCQLILFDRYIY